MRSSAEGIGRDPFSVSHGINGRRKDSLVNTFRNWWDYSSLDIGEPHQFFPPGAERNIVNVVGFHLIGLISTPVSYPAWALGGAATTLVGLARRDTDQIRMGAEMLASPLISLATVAYGTALALAKAATLLPRLAIGNEPKGRFLVS